MFTTNLGQLLTQTARRFPDHDAIIHGELVTTWSEFDHRVNAAVAALRRRGVGKSDRILVHGRNQVAYLETMWIAFKLGAIWVPINFRLAPPEVAYIAGDCRPKVLIYDSGFEEHADAARAAAPDLAFVFSFGVPRTGETAFAELRTEPAVDCVEADVGRDDPLWFFYTSGTTGHPKAATLTHGQMSFVVNNHLADLMPGLSESDSSLVVAPLSHGAGIHALVQAARGARSVLPVSDRLDPEEIWRLVEHYRVSNMFTVPTILKLLTEHEAVDKYDHSSLRQVVYSGAPMYRPDQKHALRKLGPVLVQYYGMGEVTGNITVLPARLHHVDDENMSLGSCGYARTGMQVAILSEDGAPLSAGETGAVCVRGGAVFAGYSNDEAANARSFRDGWFHTGDLGRLDERGFLYLTSRASDMYISGGSNIYPREVEEVILTHPAVSEVAVLGVPDPKWGETGCAVIVTKSGHEVEGKEIAAFLDGKLASYKRPSKFVFWPQLPTSAYGKVPKRIILERLLESESLLSDAVGDG